MMKWKFYFLSSCIRDFNFWWIFSMLYDSHPFEKNASRSCWLQISIFNTFRKSLNQCTSSCICHTCTDYTTLLSLCNRVGLGHWIELFVHQRASCWWRIFYHYFRCFSFFFWSLRQLCLNFFFVKTAQCFYSNSEIFFDFHNCCSNSIFWSAFPNQIPVFVTQIGMSRIPFTTNRFRFCRNSSSINCTYFSNCLDLSDSWWV